jgi:hypothetical protein
MVFSRDMGISRFSERSVVFTRKAAMNLNFRLDATAVKILFYSFAQRAYQQKYYIATIRGLSEWFWNPWVYCTIRACSESSLNLP